MTTRYNLLLDSSFRTLEPWEGANGARISKHTSDTVQGDTSLRVRLGTESEGGVRTAEWIPITPLLSYAASAYAKVPSAPSSAGAVRLTVQMVWRDVDGDIIARSVSPERTIRVTDSWMRLSVVATAPASATTVQFQVVNSEPVAVGDIQHFVIDAALLEQSSYVGGWVDSTSRDEKTSVLNKALTKPSAHPTEGLPLRADILLDDLVLNTIDEDDTLWVCTGIDGWWGHAAPDFPSVSRGADDGDFDMSGRYSARTITIKGTFFPSNASNLQRARDRLVSASNLVRRGAWFRTNEDPTKGAFVRLAGKPLIETVNARGKTEFSITLKAADPVRYGWNDNDNDGYTSVVLPLGGYESILVNNQGTASVHGVIELTGPLGGGSTISNLRTGETLRLLQPLRGARLVSAVSRASVRDGVATLEFSDPSDLYVGDEIVVSGLGFPYDTDDDLAIVTSISNSSEPYTISYKVQSVNLPAVTAPATASVRLARDDVLSINTYEKSVTFNGISVGNRARIDTLVDWIQFMPGDNELVVYDTRTDLYITSRSWNTARQGTITTDAPHYLSVNDKVTVDIPETAELATKSLTSNTAVLTTQEPHGFAAGDKIDVITTEVSNVTTKSVTSNVATLTTDVAGQFGTGDTITVTLPTKATPVAKSATASEVTLRTAKPHGFSNGDSITVALPSTAQAITRARANNVATLTTKANHYFSVGDQVNIDLPSTATITTKTMSTTAVTLTTAAAHGLSVGSSVNLDFPTTAVPSGTRSTSGGADLTATITTLAAHGFDVGDQITVNMGVTSMREITNRSATTTAVTLTTVTHNFAVGEIIHVQGMGTRYDGVHAISAVTSTTITYLFSGSSVASGAAPVDATVTNLTIRDGYNGNKIIESVTSTTITYFVGLLARNASSGLGGTGASVVNTTNQDIDGTRVIASVGSPTQLTFSRS